MDIQLNLKLTKKELNQFLWIAYGASFVPYLNAEGAGVAYNQIVEQIEEHFIKLDPNNKQKLEDVKKMILSGLKPEYDA